MVGMFLFIICEKCNETHVVAYGCNSRLCSNCGKNYADKWVESVSKAMFNVAS